MLDIWKDTEEEKTKNIFITKATLTSSIPKAKFKSKQESIQKRKSILRLRKESP